MKLAKKSLIRTVRRAMAVLGAFALLAGLAVSAASVAQAASGTGTITGYEGLCLDDRSASTTPGNPVQVYTCNGTNAQSWTVESNGTLQTLGECLDVTGAGTANGTLVDLYTCNGTAAQVWSPQSNGELVNPNSNACLDDTGFGGSGTQVQIWACADSSNQQWKLP
jgi:ricin-type beta-trefoil lectin protein